MANPAVSLVSYTPPRGNGVGVLVVDATWSTYAQNADRLVLTGLRLPGFQPQQIRHASGAVAATGHIVTWQPTTPPTMADAGTLRAWSGGTQVAAGGFAQTARITLVLMSRPGAA